MHILKRFLSFFVKIFLTVLIFSILFYGFLLKPLLSVVLESYWNVDFKIDRVFWDYPKTGLIFENVRIGNPYGFPRGDMLEISRIEMVFSEKILNEGALTPKELNIFAENLNLMRRLSGHLNLELFTESGVKTKKRGLKIIPEKTSIGIKRASEMDGSGPILKKKNVVFQELGLSVSGGSHFRGIVQDLVRQFLKETASAELSEQVKLPAPEYHGIITAVGETLQESASESEDALSATS